VYASNMQIELNKRRIEKNKCMDKLIYVDFHLLGGTLLSYPIAWSYRSIWAEITSCNDCAI
jgi:hypothetical protein